MTNYYLNRIKELEDAIRNHRSQKADDRCIEDDDKLYEVLGDGIKCDRRVGCKEDMLKNCQRFIENRCEGGGWPSYTQLEEKLQKALKLIKEYKHQLELDPKDELLFQELSCCDFLGSKDKYQPLKDQIIVGLGLKNDATGDSNTQIPEY